MKQFESVPIKKPAKNVFNLRHDFKMTCKFDYIYPFLCEPVYPGESWNCRAEIFARSMPFLAPIMHNVDLFVWYIFVPERLTWNENRKDDFKVFITGGEKGDKFPVKPFFTFAQLGQMVADARTYGLSGDEAKKLVTNKSLLDYLGLPVGANEPIPTTAEFPLDSQPLRAYQFFWNECFRNQNLQDEVEISFDSGQESTATLVELLKLRKRCWEKDYFTAALPFVQRGEAVHLPIVSQDLSIEMNVDNPTAPVTGLQISKVNYTDENGNPVLNQNLQVQREQSSWYNVLTNAGAAPLAGQTPGYLTADSEHGGVVRALDVSRMLELRGGIDIGTINDLRQCYRLQMWLENNARVGSRYVEQLLAHFAVVSSDARLQRPELLGGGKMPLIITDVEQNSATAETPENEISVQGNLSGKGTIYGKTNGFKKYFEEHGWLFGVLCIQPRTSYSQGVPRKFSRMSRYDYMFPEFVNLGEQAILNKEVYFDPSIIDDGDNDDVFGYQERFAEMRYIPSSVHGDFRDTLQYWHLSRMFNSRPALNAEFVEGNTRANVFAELDVQESDYDPFLLEISNDIKAVRMLPKYAIPSL